MLWYEKKSIIQYFSREVEKKNYKKMKKMRTRWWRFGTLCAALTFKIVTHMRIHYIGSLIHMSLLMLVDASWCWVFLLLFLANSRCSMFFFIFRMPFNVLSIWLLFVVLCFAYFSSNICSFILHTLELRIFYFFCCQNFIS